MKVLLNLRIGTDVQAQDTELTALAGTVSAADKVPYFTGSGAASTATFTSAGRALVDDANSGAQLTTLGLSTNAKSFVTAANYSAMRTLLGLVIGTDVQAFDAILGAFSGVSGAADKVPYFTSSSAMTVMTVTSAARNLLDDSSAALMRITLGLGSLAEQNTVNDSDWSGTDLALVNGGTGSGTASGARSNLGLGSLAVLSTINGGNWSGTDLALVNGGSGSSTAAGARTNFGLGALATLGSVGAAQIDANAVDSSELANGSVDAGHLNGANDEPSSGSTGAVITLAGGQYSFWPQYKNSAGNTKTRNISVIGMFAATAAANPSVHLVTAITTSYVDRVFIGSESGAGTITARFRYIPASPPYDLGDGEIPLFMWLAVDGLGKVVHGSTAPDPPWALNGPTNIVPDFRTKTESFRKVPRYTDPSLQAKLQRVKHVSFHRNLLSNPAKRDGFLDDLKSFREGTFDLIPIDQEIKNADMNGQGLEHPFVGNDLSGLTIVLLDPVSTLTRSLADLHNVGESISDLLTDDVLRFDNVGLPRAGPNGVMIVTPRWK